MLAKKNEILVYNLPNVNNGQHFKNEKLFFSTFQTIIIHTMLCRHDMWHIFSKTQFPASQSFHMYDTIKSASIIKTKMYRIKLPVHPY